MTIREIEEELAILRDLLSSGLFIRDALYGAEPALIARATSRYVEIHKRIQDAEGQLAAELDKIKAEVKHRLSAALVRGDLDAERDTMREEYGAKISASLSKQYDVDESQRLLKEAGLFDAAIERGALDMTPRIKTTKLTKEMKNLLADASTPKLSRVTVTRADDD